MEGSKKRFSGKSFLRTFEMFGRSFLLPVSVLPAASILKGIGSAFTNENALRMYPWMRQEMFQLIMKFLDMLGKVAFDNLPIIFAVGVAVGLAKHEKGSAALSGLLGFLVLHRTLNFLLIAGGLLVDKSAANAGELMALNMQTTLLGIQTMDLSVFGGIITGVIVYFVHKKAIRMQVPQILGFFSGPRLVPILIIPVMAVAATVVYFIWPVIQQGINLLSAGVLKSGYFGTFAYGVVERMLIPFGLHHGLIWPIRTTAIGGVFNLNGQEYFGTINAFMAALEAGGAIDPSITRFSSGKFVFTMFGYAGAALAMYRCAKPENKKVTGSLLLTAALTTLITGITEPIEFTFLFVAPALYLVHALLAGITMLITNLVGVAVLTPTGHGIINFVIYGVLQGTRTKWFWIPILGVGCFFLYYFVFQFVINKFDFKTPGREDDPATITLHTKEEARSKIGVQTLKSEFEQGGATIKGSTSNSKSDGKSMGLREQALALIEAHGGSDNMIEVDACITRLRITIKDESLMDKDRIVKELGAMGFAKSGMQMQSIYGGRASQLKLEVLDALGRSE